MSLKKFIFKFVWRFFDTIKCHRVLVYISTFFISELNINNKKSSLKKNAKRILILDALRFRGDLEIFCKDEELTFFTISWSFLEFLLKSYITDDSKNIIYDLKNERLGFRSHFRVEDKKSNIYIKREKYRKFLRSFLPLLFRHYNFKLIINSDHRYRREADICRVANELGYSYICYYREALYITPANYHIGVRRHKEFGKFYGDAILVQNEITKRMFIDSGMLNEDQIFVRGCPRMDKYINKIKNKQNYINKSQKQISYFTCPESNNTKDFKRVNFFEYNIKTILAVSKYCEKNKNLKFVIKTKDMHKHQLPIIKNAILKKFNGKFPKNIIFETNRMAAQDVILSSQIVISMQSTIVLEAGIAGVNVILPHVKSLREEKGAKQVLFYQNQYDLFDVPNDYEDLINIIDKRLKKPYLNKFKLKKINNLFEEYVSPLNKNATTISLNLIKKFVK